MEMRQNSNEVKEQKEKRNKNLRSGRQQIKICRLLENWPLSSEKRKKNLCLTQFRVTFKRKVFVYNKTKNPIT